MACNEQEAGKHKCENYWTQEEERDKQFGKFFVSLLKSRDICPDFLVRTMRYRTYLTYLHTYRTVPTGLALTCCTYSSGLLHRYLL